MTVLLFYEHKKRKAPARGLFFLYHEKRGILLLFSKTSHVILKITNFFGVNEYEAIFIY